MVSSGRLRKNGVGWIDSVYVNKRHLILLRYVVIYLAFIQTHDVCV
jgi:hypothetical protein